ncbi:MAG TPA: PadR family transcriptional regulator [Anaerolineae bacterium]|nr:PadR family transcriptional regulator [Anaerolineae bacterium]
MIDKDNLETYDKITQELRRGMLILAVLSQLKSPKYGYALINHLDEHDLEIDTGTLYPLLRRLEKQGLLESSWNTDGSRPRKYYQISPTGVDILEALEADWYQMTGVMDKLLQTKKGGS